MHIALELESLVPVPRPPGPLCRSWQGLNEPFNLVNDTTPGILVSVTGMGSINMHLHHYLVTVPPV